MIALIFASFLWASPTCDITFEKIQQMVEQKLEHTSNLAPVASEADGVLSQLLSAKSPVLLSWLERENLMSAAESVIARKWRRYYLDNFLLKKYAEQNPRIKSSVRSGFAELAEQAFPTSFRKPVEATFSSAKKQAKAFILTWPLKAEARKQAIDAVDSLSLGWLKTLETSAFAAEPIKFLESSFTYGKQTNQIFLGVKSRELTSREDFFVAFLLQFADRMDDIQGLKFTVWPQYNRQKPEGFDLWFVNSVNAMQNPGKKKSSSKICDLAPQST